MKLDTFGAPPGAARCLEAAMNTVGTTNTLPLKNRAMARQLASGACVDLKDCLRTATGDYVVTAASFRSDSDYCDSSRELWIWSIARVKRPLPSKMVDGSAMTIEPDTYLASPTTRFHGIETGTLECVWLR
jgi:hypothetical protein